MQSNLTSSGALAPWKRGEAPAAHWPGAANDERVAHEAPPMDAPLAVDDLREAPAMQDRVAVDDVWRVGDELMLALEERRTLDSELANDRRIALEAYRREDPPVPRYPDELVLDDLADRDELDDLDLADDELVLADDDIAPTNDDVPHAAEAAHDYVPALVDRTRGAFMRVASKALIPAAAILLIVIAMGGTWSTAAATPAPQWSATTPPPAAHPPARTLIEPDEPEHPAKKSNRKDLAGKLNLNTASEDQLMLLPTVGPSKAERIVTWRKKNGGFKRTADLRRVKGFGYKTFKKLEPFLDIKGDTTLAAK